MILLRSLFTPDVIIIKAWLYLEGQMFYKVAHGRSNIICGICRKSKKGFTIIEYCVYIKEFYNFVISLGDLGGYEGLLQTPLTAHPVKNGKESVAF